MVSIFTYGFPQAEKAFAERNLPYVSLTNYDSLIGLAIEKGIVGGDMENTLLNWRRDPANWKGME
jgi:orotate phosphoribosyltransferase